MSKSETLYAAVLKDKIYNTTLYLEPSFFCLSLQTNLNFKGAPKIHSSDSLPS